MSTPPFPLAMDPPATALTPITSALLEQVLEMSRASPRRRIILPLHKNLDAGLQRMLNAMQPGSYVRPHRHALPPKCESVVLLRGSLGYASFDEAGRVVDRLIATSRGPTFGVDTEPGVFHTFVCLEPDTVLFEVKDGPYERISDKDFAAWAPEEGAAEAADYLRELERIFQGANGAR